MALSFDPIYSTLVIDETEEILRCKPFSRISLIFEPIADDRTRIDNSYFLLTQAHIPGFRSKSQPNIKQAMASLASNAWLSLSP